MAEPATPTEVEALDQLDDEEFLRLVQANIDTGTGDKQLWVALVHPTVVERTAGCLDELAEALERFIAAKQLGPAHFKVRLLNQVRARVRQANAAAERAAGHHAARADELTEAKKLLRALAFAVNDHRQACIALDLAPEPHDVALWEALEDLRLPAHGPAVEQGPSLADLIVSGRWARAEVTSRG